MAGSADDDDDLLVGLLAVRHGYATPEQVVAAQSRADDQTSLIDALSRQVDLSREARTLLQTRASAWKAAATLTPPRGWPVADADPTPAPAGPRSDTRPTAPVDATRRGADLLSTPGTVDARRPVDAVTPEAAGRYDPDAPELGRGGIGRVLAVYDRHLGRRVAIKELLPASDGPPVSEADLVRFLREARVTGQLEHPNIVPVYELGQRADGTLYYSMKVVRGRTLRRALQDATTLSDRLKLLPHYVDLANAIAYAHSRGVVHRDIKPDNVMLGEFGETIVVDWGLTKVRGEPEDIVGATVRRQRALVESSDLDSATRVGDVLGTPAYMSPEQAAGDIDRIDERSDVWALGAVLFELLAGRPPFRGRAAETLWKVAEQDVPLVTELEPAAPRDLAAVAEKALRKDRDARYPTAAALVADVEAFMTGQRVTAYAYTAWELVKKFAVEHRAAAAAVFSVLLAVVVGGAATLAAYQQAREERERALVAEDRAQSARAASEENERRANDHLSMALYERAKLLNDDHDHGAAGVYAAGALLHSPWVASSPFAHPDLADRDPRVQAERVLPLRSALFHALVGQRLTWQFSLPSAPVCGFDRSDDGTFVVASARDGLLRRYDLASRDVQWELSAPACPRFVDIDPRGRWVAYTDADDAIQLVTVDGQPAGSVSTGSGADWVFQFSPDGAWLYGTNADGTVARVDVNTWTVRARATLREPRALEVSNDGRRVAVGNRWGAVSVFDATTLEVQARHSDLKSTVYGLAFSPDHQTLLAGGFEGAVVRRTLGAEAATARWPGDLLIRDLVWTGDHVLAAGQADLRLWWAPDGRLLQRARRDPAGIQRLRVGPDGRTVVTAGHGPHLDVWTLDRGRQTRLVHEDRLVVAAVSKDGRFIATLDDAGHLGWFDAATDRRRWKAQEPKAWTATFVGDELVSITSEGRVKAWSADGASRLLQASFAQRREWIVGVAAAPSGARVAWTDVGGRVAFHDRRARQRSLTPPLVPEDATALAFSPDGQRLAVADGAGNLAVWALEPLGSAWRKDGAHVGLISGVTFTPDGRSVVTSGEDAHIRWWDAETGSEDGALTGHGDWVNHVEFSADGRFLLSSSDDYSARLWDARTRLPLLEARAADHVAAATFDNTRNQLLLGLDNELVIVPRELPELAWSAEDLLALAERRAGLRLDGFGVQPVSPTGELAATATATPPARLDPGDGPTRGP